MTTWHTGCDPLAESDPVARAGVVVLANAAMAARLLAPLGGPAWPLAHSRGQVTSFASDAPSPLRLPVAGDGYAPPLPSGCSNTYGPSRSRGGIEKCSSVDERDTTA